MTTYAHPLPTQSRRRRQQSVETLLQQIDDLRRRLYLAEVSGVTRAAVSDLKREMAALRRKLAAATEQAPAT
ncbi:MAG: hypothetical protein JOZ56_11320 [Actinobacteria bacterium]|nr:hypothetical protein [Actinomycetota bacterium]MBV8563672.1 hypothetical protein [Actinomycetota bacterium]